LARAQSIDLCASGTLTAGNTSTDLVVTKKTCKVTGTPAKYTFRNVYVLEGGRLRFDDKTMDFYAQSILIQNRGQLSASIGYGAANDRTLRFHLYGSPSDTPITCVKLITTNNAASLQEDPMCGVDPVIWNSNTVGPKFPAACTKVATLGKILPGNVNDCFYPYGKFNESDPAGAYFGHKVFAVAFGGSLELLGAKGANSGVNDLDPTASGTSWARLDATLLGGENSLTLDRAVDWRPDDQLVITSTDYLPGHAEQVTVGNPQLNEAGALTVPLATPVQFPHNGTRYDYSDLPATIGPDQDPRVPGKRYVETRAAVGLLTRSIRIISDGASPDTPLDETPGNFFGGHTVFRQGFKSVNIRGVEFFRMGQGGAKGHYPIHFHMARQVPSSTFIKDSSIHDSMTRFATIHGTQGVTLQRNVGFRSIGHGFYLEDGTETDNLLWTNLGVFARGAVQNDQNKRQVPGILARPGDPGAEVPPYHSDYDHPSVFWIMNGWNDFQYNFAAGAGTCGVCYWLLPGGISGPSQYQKWESYAGMQTSGRAGLTPLKSFVGNSCSTAMTSLLNIGATTPCSGVGEISDGQHLLPVPNPNAPALGDPRHDDYYPNLTGLRNPTLCPSGDCGNSASNHPCAGTGPDQVNCTVTSIEKYTTSFNWAQKNFSAIWLRPWWFLITDSAITDVQQGGLTFVTGGGYTRADAAVGFWDLVRKSVFVGNTQPNVVGTQLPANPYASNAGPFNPSGLKCDARRGDYCLNANEGVSYPFEFYSVNQRLFNIYDGPAYQERNAYLDITTTNIGTLATCKPGGTNFAGACAGSPEWMYGLEIGVPQDVSVPSAPTCYLPNAAIGWKQSNGFYYPPAFHSDKLFFKNVEIRHFVIEPFFSATPTIPQKAYQTDAAKVAARYCTWETTMFDNFTDIDRQTELNDDDGSLTGLLGQLGTNQFRETISVNQDPFFLAPKVTVECASDKHVEGVPATALPGTVDTSPYEYVSTAMIAACGIGGNQCGGNWHSDCGGPFCYGVPLYREYLTTAEAAQLPRPKPSIRMAGQGTGQRSTLTVNHGKYYIDTQVSAAAQALRATSLNVFEANQTYYVWFIYAKPSTQQTYTIFVGENLSPTDQTTLLASIKGYRVNIDSGAYGFTAATGANFVTPVYDPGSGIVTITVDLSAYASEFSSDLTNFCRPQSYCQFAGGQCSCKSGSGCKDNNVCKWAVKEIDCPTKGCFGFGIKLPSGFVAAGKLPPDPGLFTDDPNYATNWNIPWKRVDATISGDQCHYSVDPN
jgi:hypothetical protein